MAYMPGYPKNYQLWWHRRLVVTELGQSVADRELEVRVTTSLLTWPSLN